MLRPKCEGNIILTCLGYLGVWMKFSNFYLFSKQVGIFLKMEKKWVYLPRL